MGKERKGWAGLVGVKGMDREGLDEVVSALNVRIGTVLVMWSKRST